MKFPITYRLVTPRCTLRHVSEEDIPFVFEASQVPGFTDGMLWEPPESIEELRIPFERNCQRWREGSSYSFTIELQKRVDFLGRISIRKEEVEDAWNLGFWTHPRHQGKGYMSEAVERILGFGFDELGARSIRACHAVWNLASRKVMERAGMIHVSSCDRGYQKRDTWIAQDTMEITREAWLRRDAASDSRY